MASPGSHGVVRELQQPVMIPPQMVPPQLPHYNPAPLQISYSSKRHGTKRQRTDDGPGGENDDTTAGLGLSMLSETSHADDAQSADILLPGHGDHSSHHHHHASVQHEYQSPPVHQRHHHHRLPSQATISGTQSGDTELTSPDGVTGSQSVVGQPGMPDPAPRPRGPKLKFTPEEDSLLVELKENKNLTWKQIADFFPGRTSGTLQVRYCTKLKAKATVWTDEAVCLPNFPSEGITNSSLTDFTLPFLSGLRCNGCVTQSKTMKTIGGVLLPRRLGAVSPLLHVVRRPESCKPTHSLPDSPNSLFL